MEEKGIHLECIDEKSGIQAIERPEDNKPMLPHSVEKYEHEYIRHGTQTLIAGLEVSTGKVSGEVCNTRGNVDFINFIKKRVSTDPKGEWIFIVDNLNTHKSVDLVAWLAKEINFKGDLGKYFPNSHKSFGILKSQETRARFLSDEDHRIRFVYTPKHCSWMNQIEIWFSILSKKLLRRLNCNSIEILKNKIINFIDYFNKTLAKPFKWTYEGKPLQV